MKRLSLLLLLTLTACQKELATREDCLAIIDRIVDIELAEQGFRDPALAARKKEQMHARFEHELDACIGRELPKGARACLATVRDIETLSHHCLR